MPTYHPWVRALADGLRRKCAVVEGDALLLAVSGGADSVALLRAAALLAPKRGWHLKLAVAHVHHGVRQEAEEEARFVKTLAKELNLPFYRADLDAGAFKGRNLEDAMRDARYGALAHIARIRGFGCIATAHHADDQLETLLLRLCRGCQPEALAGMRWSRPLEELRLIRPLLGMQHADALDFLRALKQDWREDAGNADERQARARLRLKVIPVLKELHPQAALKAVALAEAMGGSALADQLARTATLPLGACGDGGMPATLSSASSATGRSRPTLPRAHARALAPADLRQRLKELLHAHGVKRVNAALLAQAAHMAADHHGKTRAMDLPGGRKLEISRLEIRVQA